MISSAGYTNRIRIKAEAQNTKVQQPTKQSVNYNPLQSSLICNPNFAVIKYPFICPCAPNTVKYSK